MSIRLMTKIWDSGVYSGGTLLALLALADWSNDQGERIFPRLETLSQKARLSVKQVRRVLETLIEDKVLIDVDKTGVKANEALNFRLDLSHLPMRDKMSLGGDMEQPEGHLRQPSGTSWPAEGTPCPEPGTFAPASIDNHHTDPSRDPPRDPPLPAIAGTGFSDLELAIQAFNEHVEDCPKWAACQKLTAQRKKVIEARLREVGLEGWRAAMAAAAASAFLGGPIPITGDHRNWRVTIDWLAKADKFAKIVEGGYPASDGRDRATGNASVVQGLMAFEENHR